MVTAVIIARGGSRRLPRKNVLPFCGHPLIAWSIVQARASKLVDRIIMCTDDDEIEKTSLNYGAEVIRHPQWQENAHRTFRWALDKGGITSGEFLTILPTQPLRRPGDMDFCISERRRLDLPEIGPHTVLREYTPRKIIGANLCRGEEHAKGSEYVTGAQGFATFRVKYYLENPIWPDDMPIEEFDQRVRDNLVAREVYWYPAPWWSQFEVDTAEEFEFCEVVMNHYILKGRSMGEVYGAK